MTTPLDVDGGETQPRGPRSDVYLQRFAVPFEYPVVFTRDVFSPENAALSEALARREPGRCQRVLALVDDGLARARPALPAEIVRYAERFRERFELLAPPEIVPGGEAAKNDPGAVTGLQTRLHELRLDRHSFVVIVGGGALLDMAGYAAATTHRGLRVIRVPSTVLSQADSGVGVKNGVNARGSKNLFGTFAPPFAVLNDLRLLDTLPARDRVQGMAEAVKVALIRDAAFFEWLESRLPALTAFEPEAMELMIRRCAELHLRHIAGSGDPFETGSARPLDFGHWSAHKLEAMTRHALRHGEAVAIGMALDARYSVEIGVLGPAALERIWRLLAGLGLRLWHDALRESDPAGRPRVLEGLEEFREHLGGELTLTLLSAIGRGVEVTEIREGAMLRALSWLEARARAR